MKTRQGTGYFQQAPVILLLCLVSSFVFAASAFALTGNNIDQCYDCHGTRAVPGPADIRPNDSTYRNITTGAFVGNHRTHMATLTTLSNVCTPCHGPAPLAMDHRNGKINMRQHINSSATTRGTYSKGVFFNQTSVPLPGNCSSVNCHFQKTTPNWGSTPYTFTDQTVNDCDQCHGNGTLSAPQDGSHPGNAANKHGVYYGTGTNSCVKCHADHTVDANKFAHATSAGNRALILQGSELVPTNYSLNPGNLAYPTFMTNAAANRNGTCTNLYCHSDGTKASGFTNIATPLAWGNNGTTTCASCHGNAASLATGSHGKHLVLTGVTCAFCHNATASDNTTIANVANHVNKSVTLNFNASAAPAGGTYNGQIAGGATVYQKPTASAAGTCSTSVCHGGNSGTWGIVDNNNTCTKCHGTPTVSVTAANRYVIAPPVNTAGVSGTLTGTGLVSNDVKVGAHQTHLQFLNGFSNYSTVDFRCQGCHGPLPVIGNHANGSSTPVFQGLANNRGAMAAAYVGANCNSTYCHNPAGSGGTLNAANAGTGITPSWTDATYIAAGTPKTQANCGKCHKSPGDAGFTANYTHAANITQDCSGCHGHNGDTAGIAGQRHLDGKKYGSGSCNTCHDYDTTGGGTTWGTTNFGGTPGMEGRGAHAKHIEYLKTRFTVTLNATTDSFGTGSAAAVCGVCHTNNGANHTTGDSTQPRSINFGDGSITRQFGASAPLYNGIYNTSSFINPKTCSNIDCHYNTTPLWSAQ